MADLSKIADDLSALTVLQAADLAKMLVTLQALCAGYPPNSGRANVDAIVAAWTGVLEARFPRTRWRGPPYLVASSQCLGS